MEIRANDYSPLITSIYGVDQQEINNSSGQNLRSQGDTVTISEEAFALAKQNYIDQSEIDEALLEEKKNIFSALKDANITKSTSASETNEEAEAAAALRKKFGEYMYTPDGISKNGSSSDGNIDKQIEALEKKVETLQGQLQELSESSVSGLELEGQAASIHKNIEGINTEISELRNQQAKQGKAPEASSLAKK